MKRIIVTLAVFALLAVSIFGQDKPEWTSSPLKYGIETYDQTDDDSQSPWEYIWAVTPQQVSSESRAKSRAEQALQSSLASNIATVITKNMDKTSFSEMFESEEEDVLVRYEEALNAAVTVKVPKIDYLEYFTESSVIDGRTFYRVYVFGRCLKSDVRSGLEKLNVDKAVDAATRNFEKAEGIKVSEEYRAAVKASFEAELIEYVAGIEE